MLERIGMDDNLDRIVRKIQGLKVDLRESMKRVPWEKLKVWSECSRSIHLDYGQTPNLGVRPTKILEASLETERSDDGGRQGHRPEIVSAIRAA